MPAGELQSSAILFTFRSTAEFCTHQVVKLFNRNTCNKAMADNGRIQVSRAYELRKISTEEYKSIGRHPRLLGDVVQAMLSGAELPFVDLSMQECDTCAEIKPLGDSAFRKGGDRTCRTCRNKQQLALEKKKKEKVDEAGSFVCNQCHVEKPSAERLVYRNVCRECHRISEHDFHQKKMEADPGYMTRRLQARDEQRQKNPDLYQEHYKTSRKKAETKMNAIQANAAVRNIRFVEEDRERMALLLKEPCHWCRYQDPEGYPQGLDRIHNDGPYSAENVVPSCGICNIKRGLLLFAEFPIHILHMCDGLNVEIPERLPESRHYLLGTEGKYGRTAQKHQPLGRKKDELPADIRKRLKSGICSMCNFNLASQVDRVNNDEHYTLSNSQGV
ncbi:hypothetical protein HDU78_004550 [Chytriomyces hyalinus]|nr:hypothetical protein HDU78_004550 [Chytriomyces hyalinus]